MPERDCRTCKRKEEWGCEAKPYTVIDENGNEQVEWLNPAHLPVTILGEESWACPRQSLRENPKEWSRLLMLYGFYQKGHLPDAGSVVDQSNSLLETFRIMDDANALCDQAQAERKQRHNARQAGGRRP